jgi:hypothetical protein
MLELGMADPPCASATGTVNELFTHEASHFDFTLALTHIVGYSINRDINLAATTADRASDSADKTLERVPRTRAITTRLFDFGILTFHVISYVYCCNVPYGIEIRSS